MSKAHGALLGASTAVVLLFLSNGIQPIAAYPSRTITIAPSDEAASISDGVAAPTATSGVPSPASPLASQPVLAPHAKSAVLMDYATGKVLYERSGHVQLPMASITKIMTMLLIMEALDDGKIRLTDRVKTSDYAASMGGSQIFLEAGEAMTVNDMLKGIAVASANDACVAMAEHLCGTETAFVAQMNERARELGMDDTHFTNCNGLPAAQHHSSAHDIAIMSRALLEHQEITKWTSVYSDYLRKETPRPLWLVNTNKLVRFYEGVDGLKTGFTSEAKYCLSATAKNPRGFRVIAVVMGEPKSTIRNAEVSGMLNWSFNQFDSKILYQRGQVVAQNVHVQRGSPKTVDAVAAAVAGIVYSKGTKPQYMQEVQLSGLRAPIRTGQRIGTLTIRQGEQVVATVPLLAKSEIRRASLWEMIGRILTFNA